VLVVQILILIILLLIFVQDILSRSVYWIVFPILVISFVTLRVISNKQLANVPLNILVNCCFLALQLLLVSAWFSLRRGKLVNIMSELLGWGDILFLISICFYLSVLNFLFFYIISLISILLLWFGYQNTVVKKDRYIPLAGLQAILFMFFFITDQWVKHVDLTKDDWLLQFIMG
jgi:hypothetical protein